MRTVQDENALEAPETAGARWYYLRSLLDPRVVMHSKTGENFARRDGQKWEHPVYHVSADRTGRAERSIGSAYCGHLRYRAAVPT